MNTGRFVISLDFELMWGVRDKKTVKSYGANMMGVPEAMEKFLDLLHQYDIEVTVATVGFLFHESLEVLRSNIPVLKPVYHDPKLSPYLAIGLSEIDDVKDFEPYYFGTPLFNKLKSHKLVEIGTHTYSHYYCIEQGPSIEQFESDIKMAVQIAKGHNVDINSIIFPRNQYTPKHLEVCSQNGISTYRSTEKHDIYRNDHRNPTSLYIRARRLIDAYINISGHHCYGLDALVEKELINIPSSRFFRAYNSKLSFLEFLKLRRIKKAMTHAAKNGLVYHLWWHPHNIGVNIDKNIKTLSFIFEHYSYLNRKYNMQSRTMGNLSKEIAQGL